MSTYSVSVTVWDPEAHNEKTVSDTGFLEVKNLHIYTGKITCSTVRDFPTENNDNEKQNKLNKTKIDKGCTKHKTISSFNTNISFSFSHSLFTIIFSPHK